MILIAYHPFPEETEYVADGEWNIFVYRERHPSASGRVVRAGIMSTNVS